MLLLYTDLSHEPHASTTFMETGCATTRHSQALGHATNACQTFPVHNITLSHALSGQEVSVHFKPLHSLFFACRASSILGRIPLLLYQMAHYRRLRAPRAHLFH